MKEGWEYKEFKDIFPIKMGKTPPRGDKSCWDTEKEGNNKWVSIADISSHEGKIIYDTKEYISDSSAKKINKVDEGSLLMSFKLSIGKMAFAGVPLYTNEAIIAIPDTDDYDLHWIYYYLLSYDWKSLTDGNEKVKGATLNKTSIGKIKIPILNLSEQQEIVEYLDSSFAKIDALKANAAKSLEEAKSLFQSALKEALEPKKGWEEKTMDEVVDLNTPISYGIVQPGEDIPNGIPVVRPVDLVGKFISLNDNIKRTSKENSESYKRTILNGKEILMCVRGTTGIVSLSDESLKNCNVTRGIVPLKISDDTKRLFVYYTLIAPIASDFIQHKTKGTALKQINIADVKMIPINLPTYQEQQSIVSHLDSLNEKVNTLQQNYSRICNECDALKQAILRQVFE